MTQLPEPEVVPNLEHVDTPLKSVKAAGHSPFKLICKNLLVLSIIFVFLSVVIHRFVYYKPKKPEIVYAKRYSDEFMYRPAASPIITETLKDGRLRVRGATSTPTAPTPTPTVDKKEKLRRQREKKRKMLKNKIRAQKLKTSNK